MSLEANEYENRCAKSDTIKQRYELLSREYNSQNKVFEEKHKEIVAAEKQKRAEIIQNFESHLAEITKQVAVDSDQTQQNEVVTENKML